MCGTTTDLEVGGDDAKRVRPCSLMAALPCSDPRRGSAAAAAVRDPGNSDPVVVHRLVVML